MKLIQWWNRPLYSERSVGRGYAYDYKRVSLAYAAETVIVITSLYASWLFAKQYAHTSDQRHMMMLAPIAYGVVEFCRVPMALSIRKPSNWLLKLVLVIGLLGAACVTVKSISQLGEIMFRPRLTDVTEARKVLADADSGVAMVTQQIRDADAQIAQRHRELDAADGQLQEDLASLAKLPKQECSQVSGVTRDGRAWKGQKCTPDPRIGPLNESVKQATATRDLRSKAFEQATAERQKISRVPADDMRRKAVLDYRETVMNSQLHSFTAMWYGKEPTEVTDGEIHTFLRIFVFIPAIGAAFAATFMALTAIVRIKRSNVEIEDSNYVIGSFAKEILQEATARTIKETQEAVRAAKPPPFKVA